ncbi:MAG: alpha/beta hydrolase [Liquorilactobacillus nagelii]|jgi:acetyl esterase/lipase|uniref:alpha/beta hydrolase n=1 Tax=Liquorilactobacillus nagelii TaxID=82688 RepID=UPI00242F9B59|nr:alpha/beta hydrolase [Liquorilactobacillus nagelii]MCI1921370.1 alpha/beta hydrolase [Liquorilactobacillus nagelii]MCI1977530.1 alpha/beta hydrolase [Liquorilactobacillus nagelii]
MNCEHNYLKPFQVNDFPEDTTKLAEAILLDGNDEPKYPTCLTNIAYDSENSQLLMNILMPPVYIPETGIIDQRKFPLIVWIQGSAFAKQEIGLHLPHLVEFAQQGYVIAAITYQGTESGGHFPSTIRDTNCALNYLLEHTTQYHIDSQQIFLWGESSGAYTAIMTAVTQNEAFFFKNQVKPQHFKGIIDFYGPTVMQELDTAPSIQEHRSANSWVGKYFNQQAITSQLKDLQQADPRKYLSPGLPPFLIFHGTLDMIVPFQQSLLLKQALDKNQIENTFVAIQGSNHGTDAFWSPAAKKIVFNFLNKNCEKEEI